MQPCWNGGCWRARAIALNSLPLLFALRRFGAECCTTMCPAFPKSKKQHRPPSKQANQSDNQNRHNALHFAFN